MTTKIRAKKRLGQNFLADTMVAAAIVEAAELSKEDSVLEIGPGQGALTRLLAEASGQVVAVEIDQRLEKILFALEAEYPNLRVVWADFMQTSMSELALDEPRTKVVANIPYYITTPILLKLLHASELEKLPMERVTTRPERIILMVQEEVARRLMATPGNKDYGSLSVISQYAAEITSVIEVPRTAFHPRPNVDSRVVKLVPRSQAPIDVPDPARFFRVVRAAFAQRRKTYVNALMAAGFLRESIEAAYAELGFDGMRRGETLSLEEFAALSRVLR